MTINYLKTERIGQMNGMGEGRITMILERRIENTQELRFPLKLNLQHFAEGGDGSQGGEGNGQDDGAGTGDQGTSEGAKSFDDLLKDKAHQSEFDKRIAKALETAKGKWEADYTKKLEEAKTEAEKLSKMKAEEKAQYEIEKKQKELDDKLRAITLRELKAEAQSQLVEMGISKDYADFINYESAESVKASIDKLSAIRDADLAKAVSEKLGGNEPPKRGNSTEDVETEKLRKIMGL